MEATKALRALAHDTRLAVFRFLVPRGPEGAPAGRIGRALGVPPNSLSFHLSRLVRAGLVRARRNGRQILYAVDYEAVGALFDFLTDECCREAPSGCLPHCPTTRRRRPGEGRREGDGAALRRPGERGER